jgi:hypothetical protein
MMVELVTCQSHQTPSSRRCIQAPSCEHAFQDLYLEMIQSQPLLLGRLIPILPFDTNPAPSIILLSGFLLVSVIQFTLRYILPHTLCPMHSSTDPFRMVGGLGLLAFISHVLIYGLNMC